MSNLSSLRKSMADVEAVAEELTKTDKKKFEKPKADERYWKLTRDEAGNGYATIRFLPPASVDGEKGKMFVEIWDHGFHGPQGEKGPWYIEKSLTTLGQKDPVSEHNSKLWNTGLESNKDIARKQKRRLKFHSNILVVDDPAHPENNGKVFLFAYGKKIKEKIDAALKPAFKDEPKINVFDFWEGANFKLRIRQGSNNFPTYEDSKFDSVSAVANGDEKSLQEIWDKEYSLNELIDPKNFKSYDELKTILNRVLQLDQDMGSPMQTTSAPAATVSPGNVVKTKTTVVSTKSNDKDDSLKSFEDLLNE